MVSVMTSSRIAEIESPSFPQSDRPGAYAELLRDITTSSVPSDQLPHDLVAFVDSILGDALGIVAARPLLATFVDTLGLVGDTNAKVAAGSHTLRILEPRVVSFEEQDASLRKVLAKTYQAEEDYTEAAKVLQGFHLESSQRKVTDAEKVGTWIQICRLYLEVDDTVSAETYLNRAKTLLYKVDDRVLNLTFQLSQARILDSRKKFLDASQIYYSISTSPAVAEDERNFSLSKAIICAILESAGPQRSRLLGKLHKDDRAAHLDEFSLLEKMFFDHLISKDEAEKFATKLSPHQLAITADSTTVLQKAVIEHNLLAVSRLYSNIRIYDLGGLLGLSEDKAGEYAARMLQEGRVLGHIDQICGIVYFAGGEAWGSSLAIRAQELRKWDANISSLTEDVERVATMVQPES